MDFLKSVTAEVAENFRRVAGKHGEVCQALFALSRDFCVLRG